MSRNFGQNKKRNDLVVVVGRGKERTRDFSACAGGGGGGEIQVKKKKKEGKVDVRFRMRQTSGLQFLAGEKASAVEHGEGRSSEKKGKRVLVF